MPDQTHTLAIMSATLPNQNPRQGTPLSRAHSWPGGGQETLNRPEDALPERQEEMAWQQLVDRPDQQMGALAATATGQTACLASVTRPQSHPQLAAPPMQDLVEKTPQDGGFEPLDLKK